MSRIARFISLGSMIFSVLAVAPTGVGAAAVYPSAAPLLHQSMTVMQRSIHTVHATGMIETEGCCPKTPALLHITGDCVTQSNVYALRADVHGTMSFDGKSVVKVDFHHILRSSHTPPSIGIWTRSPATHNTWQVASLQTLPTHDTDLMAYLCPSPFIAQFTQHFPTHLVNLGSMTVHGVSAWHLQDRIAVTRGGMKGTVLQSDFYLARPSLHWLRYESLQRETGLYQHVVVDYSRLNLPATITAPTIGSSLP